MCLPCLRLTRRQSLLLALGAVSFLAGPPRWASASTEVAPGLRIRPRNDWGGDLAPVGPLLPEHDVRFLLVHHSAGPTDYSPDRVPDLMRGSFRFHTGPEKRWNDVCYNFFIDRFGDVWEGRSGSLSGPVMADATGGSQGFAQLVCLLGNFQDHQPSSAMVDSLVVLLAWLSDRHGMDSSPGATTTFVSRGSNKFPEGAEITTRTISGHRDVSHTLCPGDNLYPRLADEIPARVSQHRLATGPPEDEITSEPEDVPTVESTNVPVPEEGTTEPDSHPSVATTVVPDGGPDVDSGADVRPGSGLGEFADGRRAGEEIPAGRVGSTGAVGAEAPRPGGTSSVPLTLAIGGTAVAAGAFVVHRHLRHGDSRPDPSGEE